jgi:molybdopterin/thiamine biosynthesis adenylyltransferase
MRLIIIGCGGVGSWLAPQISRLGELTLVDGDTLEPKNLDRQLFESKHIGMNKAEALAEKLGASAVPQYLTRGSFEFRRSDVILCCVDNHAARRAVLDACDRRGCITIIGANETTDAEAYVYERAWQGTQADPRVRYPEILTDTTGDPTAPIGCTGQAADERPQLVTANAIAACLMASLLNYHVVNQLRGTYPDTTWPIHHMSSFTACRTIRLGELLPTAIAA